MQFPTRLIAAAVLALGCLANASACERLAIQTLPLSLAIDETHSYSRLTAMAQGKPTFALTKVKYSAVLFGCTLTVGYADQTIFIASEFSAHTCARHELLAHELRHVQAYAVALSTLADRVHAALATRPLDEAVLDELQAVEQQHQAIDLELEYHRLMLACDATVTRVTGLKP